MRRLFFSLVLLARAFGESAGSAAELAAAGERLTLAGQFDEALPLLERALKIHPEEVRALRALGLLYYSRGEFSQAVRHLKVAARHEPRSFRTRFLLAASLVQLNDREALPELKAAYQLKPGAPDAAKLLAIEYMKGFRFGDAARVLRPIFDATAPDPEVYQLLIESLHKSGNYDGAMELTLRAVEAFPQSPVFHTWLGVQLEKAGRVEDAMQSVTRAMALDPDHQPAYYALGLILLRQERSTEAIAQFRTALDKDPADIESRLRLARALSARQNDKEALEHLKIAATQSPNNPAVHLELSRLHLRMGNKAESKKEVELYRALNRAAQEPETK